jgi:hypothetical protein
LGTIYFDEVGRISGEKKLPFSITEIAGKFSQIMLLTIGLIIFLVIVSIPVSILLTLAALINPILAQIAMLILTFLVIWLLFPLFFSPHGIFINRQNVIVSILNSLRLVRFFLPGTGLLIFTMLLISQGLNLIWQMAPESSWMALIGITGHAFTSTGLLAATFVYYRGGVKWMEESLKRIAPAQQPKTNNS